MNTHAHRRPEGVGWCSLLRRIQTWVTVVALPAGKVFFVNVCAPDRLDFRAIGAAVNMASRVVAPSKTGGRPLLITKPVALFALSGRSILSK